MNSIGGAEILLILIIATIVIGPQKVRDILKRVASLISRLKTESKELEENAGVTEEINDLKKTVKEAVSNSEIKDLISEADEIKNAVLGRRKSR